MNPGDIAPRSDTDHELYVTILSNSIHLAAATGRVITCPFIPGHIDQEAMAMTVTVTGPDGTVLPELVQWLPTSAIDDPIGNIGQTALQQTAALVTALIT